MHARDRLLEQRQAFGGEFGGDLRDSGYIPAGTGEAFDQAGGDRIAGLGHDDRDTVSPLFGGKRRGVARGQDHVDMAGDEFVDEPGQTVNLALPSATLEQDVLVGDVTALGKGVSHRRAQEADIGGPGANQPDTVDFA